jgi:hypothetical protein
MELLVDGNAGYIGRQQRGRNKMTTETIRTEIIRQFEDLRFLLSEGIRTGELQPMQTIAMLEQLNQAQWLIEQGMKQAVTQ